MGVVVPVGRVKRLLRDAEEGGVPGRRGRDVRQNRRRRRRRRRPRRWRGPGRKGRRHGRRGQARRRRRRHHDVALDALEDGAAVGRGVAECGGHGVRLGRGQAVVEAVVHAAGVSARGGVGGVLHERSLALLSRLQLVRPLAAVQVAEIGWEGAGEGVSDVKEAPELLEADAARALVVAVVLQVAQPVRRRRWRWRGRWPRRNRRERRRRRRRRRRVGDRFDAAVVVGAAAMLGAAELKQPVQAAGPARTAEPGTRSRGRVARSEAVLGRVARWREFKGGRATRQRRGRR
mmetsp:Transcript_5055/g.16192  ORF Transcript_5055/g.16192 Transcript_5055/m.16192 type:complete len:290 (+) Transcript_5055:848-1717(+)